MTFQLPGIDRGAIEKKMCVKTIIYAHTCTEKHAVIAKKWKPRDEWTSKT